MLANIVIELPIEDEALAARLEKLAPADRLAALVANRLAQVCHTAQAITPPAEAPAQLFSAARGCVTPAAAAS